MKKEPRTNHTVACHRHPMEIFDAHASSQLYSLCTIPQCCPLRKKGLIITSHLTYKYHLLI